MLNQMVLIGRIVSDLKISETKNGKKFTTITVAVTRNYKNDDGEYETDFIPCVLWNTIAVSTCKYCKKGDIVGVKGSIQSMKDKIEVVAEKVTFLSNESKA